MIASGKKSSDGLYTNRKKYAIMKPPNIPPLNRETPLLENTSKIKEQKAVVRKAIL